MEKIQLHSVLPQVFAQRNDLDSEIWKQDVTFEKGHLYLIEAESGSGKSTFCSYVLGYRHDYSGSVMFDNDVTANYKVKDWVEMRKKHISHLFQELRLFPELTALENVEIKNKIINSYRLLSVCFYTVSVETINTIKTLHKHTLRTQ